MLTQLHDFLCGCPACAGAGDSGSVDPLGGTLAGNGKAILTPEQAGENLTRRGYSWHLNNYGELDDGVLNFAFWRSYDELASSYYVNADGTVALEEVELADKFSTFSATQIAAAEKALALWDDLIAIRFQRTDASTGDIMFGNTESAPGSGAYAYLPFGSTKDASYQEQYGFTEIGRIGGDVWINNFTAANQGSGANGTYMLHTMLHEIGHALGLSHAGQYNASQDLDGDGQPDPITYATHATIVQDTHQYSIMSYFTADRSGASHIDWRSLDFVLPSTPMVHDILAAQKLYGADTGTRTGDTIYGFNSTADRDAFDFTKTELPVVTIWDAGGIDTLDFSGWNSNSLIDLNEGAFSSGGGTGFLPLAELKALGVVPQSFTEDQYAALKSKYNSPDGMLKDNIAIAYGVTIENAVGGAGNDKIIGNAAANILNGGGGHDVLDGGTGADTLLGGAGNDTVRFSAVNRGAVPEAIGRIDGGDGYDVLDLRSIGPSVVGTIETAPGVYAFGIYAGSQRFAVSNIETILLGSGDDYFNSPDNAGPTLEVRGGDGADQFQGAGSYALFGEGGDDSFFISGRFGQSATSGLVDGGSGANTLRTNIGFTVDLTAGTAVSGSSRYTISNIQKVVVTTAGYGSTVTGDGAANDFSVSSLDDNGAAGVSFFGMGGDDILTGSAGEDLLDGGSGADAMAGRGGNDVYFVDDIGDVVTERSGEGADEVRTSLASYTLALNVETLTGVSAAGQALTGNGANNVITGNTGNDTLDGNGGSDRLVGGAGNDLYIVDSLDDVVVEKAGEGDADEVRTALSDYTLALDVEVLTYTGAGNATLRGNAANNVLNGAAGNDIFYLAEGGNDRSNGGAGNDAFLFGAALTAGDVVSGGDGADVVAIQGQYSALALGAGNLVDVETLSLVSGKDTRFGDTAGNLYSYNIRSVDANVAAGGKLIVNGAALLSGEDLSFDGSEETNGTLFIYGGRGVDRLIGGAGADVFFLAEGRLNPGDSFNGGGGNDIVVLRGDFSGANAAVFTASSVVQVETVSLLSATDTRFFGGGSRYSYDLTSHDGNVAAGAVMTVNGGQLLAGETVTFNGGAELDGAFRLFSGAGNDRLTGGAGADMLSGGLGSDVLTGGGGADVFRYNSSADSTAAAADRILDFASGADKIDLSRIDANTANGTGNDAFSFIGAAAFSQKAGELRVTSDGNGSFLVEGDTNGDGVADLAIIVAAGGVAPVMNDFFL